MLSVLKDFREEYKDAVERIAKEKEIYEVISKRIKKGTAREYDEKELVMTKETISYLDGKIDTLKYAFDKIASQSDNMKVVKTILIDIKGNEIILHDGVVIKSDLEWCKEETLSLENLYTLAKKEDFTITMFSIQPNIDSWIG